MKFSSRTLARLATAPGTIGACFVGWQPPSEHAFFRYGLAVTFFAISLGIKLVFAHFNSPFPFAASSIVAITITVWYCGRGPGVLAVTLSFLAMTCVVPSIVSVPAHIPYHIAAALLVFWISASRLHSERLLRQARTELEQKVEEQTTELQRANKEMRAEIAERKLAQEAVKRAESHLRLVLDTTPALIHTGRSDGYLDYFNQPWLDYVGLPLDNMQGWAWTAVIHPDDVEGLVKRWRAALASGEPFQGESRLRRADGKYRWMLHRKVPLDDEQGNIVKWYGSSIDIEDSKRAEEQLARYTRLLKLLSGRLFEVQEEERRHLARELHDQIGQTLTAAKLNLKIIAPDVPPAVGARFKDSIQLLDRLLTQVRELSLDLRPPLLDELGLVPALRWLADQQAQRSRLRVTFTTNVECLEVDSPIQTACFRVAQEAITNAIRHGRASMVAVKLRAEADGVCLVVRDDGVGFDRAAGQEHATHGASIGMLSMSERASLLGGELEIESAPGRGTEIRAWFPFARQRAEVTAARS